MKENESFNLRGDIQLATCSTCVDSLFQPFTVGSLKISNRIVMAPMSRSFSPGGIPSIDVAQYYRRRAENAVGLIITEGTFINHPAAGNHPNKPRFHGDDPLKGWAKVVTEVHDAGGRIIPQLWHVGMDRKIGDYPNPWAVPVGPSGIDANGDQVTRPMSDSEIGDTILAYARAAADAQRLQFDGIELQGGHGYLIDQFFWGKTNRRTDTFGGDISTRARFAVEVVKACRSKVGTDFPIVFRFSQWKFGHYDSKLVNTPQELELLLLPLIDAGVDVFHCSARRFWEPEFEGSSLGIAGWTKKLTGKPTIAVGSVGLNNDLFNFIEEGIGASPASMDRLLEKLDLGEFDLVAVGRALLADPEWVIKIGEGRYDEIRSFEGSLLGTLF